MRVKRFAYIAKSKIPSRHANSVQVMNMIRAFAPLVETLDIYLPGGLAPTATMERPPFRRLRPQPARQRPLSFFAQRTLPCLFLRGGGLASHPTGGSDVHPQRARGLGFGRAWALRSFRIPCRYP